MWSSQIAKTLKENSDREEKIWEETTRPFMKKMSAALDRNQVQILSQITTGTTWKSESFGSPSVWGNSEPYRFGIRSPAEIKCAPTSSTLELLGRVSQELTKKYGVNVKIESNHFRSDNGKCRKISDLDLHLHITPRK